MSTWHARNIKEKGSAMIKTALYTVLPLAMLLALSCGITSKNPIDSGAEIPFGITLVSIPGGTFEMGDVENTGKHPVIEGSGY